MDTQKLTGSEKLADPNKLTGSDKDTRALRFAQFIYDVETGAELNKYKNGFYYWLKNIYKEIRNDMPEI